MATQSTCKRIRNLRKKNRNLLEKLETHSSIIETELRKLKGSIRGKRLINKSASKDENHSKAWVKRNESKQVLQALNISSPEKVIAVNSCHQTSTVSDYGGNKTNTVEVNEKDEVPTRICRCCLQTDDISSNKIIEAKREILRSIDYSPKSTFLRRMKSRYISHCSCEKGAEERKRKHVPDPEPPEISVSSSSKEDSSSSCNDLLPGKKCAWKEEVANFVRLKQFRDSHWLDCHADNFEGFNEIENEPKQKPFLPSVHNKWNEKYKVNERLFAEPTGISCNNFVRCSHCLDKTMKPCGSSRNQVVVSIPGSLLDVSNLVADGKCVKLKIRDSTLKTLTKRPKPCNSMALRFQKGIN